MNPFGALRLVMLRLPDYARKLRAGWDYRFQDIRLITEIGGDVQHFLVPAQFQQKVVRGAYVIAGLLLGFIAVTVSTSGYLYLTNVHLRSQNTQLVQNQQAIAEALADEVGPIPNRPPVVASNGAFEVGLAARIHERGVALRILSSAVSSNLRDLTSALRDGLGGTEREAASRHTDLGRGGRPITPTGTAPTRVAASASLAEALEAFSELRGVYSRLPSRLPMSDFYTSSGFGDRLHPVTGEPDDHPGLDLVPKLDDHVAAVMAGRVVFAGPDGSYGLCVLIRHSDHVQTRYAHLRHIDLKFGEHVALGQMIGLAGSTGLSTGKHLHYEVLLDGHPVNPIPAVLLNPLTADLVSSYAH